MVKCYSVRLKSLISISDKAFVATSFDGTEAIIPKSQVFGQDWNVMKSEAYWISAWILSKKAIQYSLKKWTMFSKTRKNIGRVEFRHHTPIKINKKINHDESLTR